MAGGATALPQGQGHADVGEEEWDADADAGAGEVGVDAHVVEGGTSDQEVVPRSQGESQGWYGHRHRTGLGLVEDWWQVQVLPCEVHLLSAPSGLQPQPGVHSLG